MVGDIAKRDPHLLAVQYPIVAVAAGVGAHPDHVRTGVRLGQAKRRELFALRLRDEIFLLLLFGAPAINAQAVKPDVHRHRHAQESVARLEFLADEPERDVVKPRSAILLRDANTHQSRARPSCRNRSARNTDFSSHSLIYGATSPWHKFAHVCCRAICSSDNARSITVISFLS